MRRKEMRGTVENTVEAIKATLPGRRVFYLSGSPAVVVARFKVTSDMPFSRHQSTVAGRSQMLGNSGSVVAKIALIGLCAEAGTHMANACAMRV